MKKGADGIAKKGKTKGKEIKMAAGGVAGKPELTGKARAAQVSGRTFKKGGKAAGGVAGKPDMVGLDRAAAMSGRTMPTTGRPAMRKGGMAKKGCK